MSWPYLFLVTCRQHPCASWWLVQRSLPFQYLTLVREQGLRKLHEFQDQLEEQMGSCLQDIPDSLVDLSASTLLEESWLQGQLSIHPQIQPLFKVTPLNFYLFNYFHVGRFDLLHVSHTQHMRPSFCLRTPGFSLNSVPKTSLKHFQSQGCLHLVHDLASHGQWITL